MRKQFKAPWDNKLMAISGIVVALLLCTLYFISGTWVSLIVWGTLLGCAAPGVYGYSIQDGKLKILRLGWTKEINFRDIKKGE